MAKLSNLLDRLRPAKPSSGGKRPLDANQPSSSAQPVGSVASTAMVAGTRVTFDLEWSPVEDSTSPGPELLRARKLGYTHFVMLPDGRLVGLSKGIQGGSGKPHSAVVMLIERFSSGGAEACILGLGKRVAFVGLMDRRPVPGFDRLLDTLDEALSLLRTFRDIHVDENVRVATNLPDQIANAETLQLNAIFEMPESGSMVRQLFNRALFRTVVSGVAAITVVGGSIAGYLWNQHKEQLKKEEAARLAYENDPNRVYERDIDQLLIRAGLPGNALLTNWREIIRTLPLSREGWSLQRVECKRQDEECVATWIRNYGNFSDFETKTANSDLSKPATGSDVDLLKSALTTRYPVKTTLPASAAASSSETELPTLQRNQLPLESEATSLWGSRLQDLTLVASGSHTPAATSLRPGRLFGPPSVHDMKLVNRPVVSLGWQVSDSIWSLPSIDLPDSAVPETLIVELSPTQVVYTLSGNLYAKGKTY